MQQINSILYSLDKAVELDLTSDEILLFNSKLKDIEKKLKTKQKKHKISISRAVWVKAEKLTKQLGIDTTAWIEKAILQEIQNSSAIVKIDNYEDYLEEETKKLAQKYSQNKDLVKTDKYVQAKEIEFSGHSVVDGEPIYHVKNKELEKKLNKVVKMKAVTLEELSNTIQGNEDKEIIIADKDKTIF